ncbi:MAG TPA: hypothetical protein VGL93_29810 [Streptosporangiaceae bacterium]|jgi:hypothetical protein
MDTRARPHPPRPWYRTAARLGQTAWLFGNLYEALVGMPQLLADAHAARAPRLLGPGSPLRYYAPAAPAMFGATALTLVRSWQSGGDRRVITAHAASMTVAVALTAHLVRTVNIRLLTSAEPLSGHDRRRMVAAWHRANALRLAALATAAATLP